MKLKEKITQCFCQKPVMTIDEICSVVGRAEITVKKALRELDYFTSYNFNSRFYTLATTPRWDSNGIWKHSRGSFTRHGTLQNLIVWLVEYAKAGLSSGELADITGVNVWATLGKLVNQNRLRRVRAKGQCFYFTARSEAVTETQIAKRFKKMTVTFDGQEKTAQIEELQNTIMVLLEIIRSQPNSIKALGQSLQGRSKHLTPAFIKGIVDRYHIHLKKN